jgi:hypothetical protein
MELSVCERSIDVNDGCHIVMKEVCVKYRARLKSNRGPTGSDRVRQKGLGFNL